MRLGTYVSCSVVANALLPRQLRGLAPADTDFQPVKGPSPDLSRHRVPPNVPPPAGATSVVRDIFGNCWALSSGPQPKLLVLAGQEPVAWMPDRLSDLPLEAWHSLAADEFGFLWAASARRLMRLDPHEPEAGWTNFSVMPEIAGSIVSPVARSPIAALGVAPSGALLVAFEEGLIAEVNCDESTAMNVYQGPLSPSEIGCDDSGDVWVGIRSKESRLNFYRKVAAANAWQHTWEEVGRLPAGNHDLSGDLLPNGNFVMAGGQSAGFGYPAIRHTFDQVFEFDRKTYLWRAAGKLQQPRFYNATSVLDSRIWVIGGNRRDPAPATPAATLGEMHFLDSVEICDPSNGVISAGPKLPFPMEMPIALQINGRIYVAGGVTPGLTTGLAAHAYNGPGKLMSIGLGDSSWRAEPDGPTGMGPLAAAAYRGSLYVTLPNRGLFLYDTVRRRWSAASAPGPVRDGKLAAARSAQVVFYRDELWVLGGRDVPMDASQIFNPATGAWRDGPRLPRQLAWGAAGVVGDRLMMVGGAGGRGYSDRTFLLRC